MILKIDPQVLRLITSVECNVEKVVGEALDLWVKQNVPICPINKKYCIDPKGSCNNCESANSKIGKNFSRKGDSLETED